MNVDATAGALAPEPRSEASVAELLHARRFGAWADAPGWLGALCTIDHKRVGRRFIVTAFGFFIAGGAVAGLMRLQLARPDSTLIGPDLYNQLFTVHGTSMMFVFAVPIMQAMGVYFVPLMVGARNIAFPRLIAYAYWVYLFGGLMLYAALVLGIGPDAGWFSYTPLAGPQYGVGKRSDFWAQLITFTEVSGLLIAVAVITTVFKLRAPGMLPYEAYFYSSGAVEDRWKPSDVGRNRFIVVVGFVLGSLLCVALIVVGAQFFAPRHIEPQLPGVVATSVAVHFGVAGLLIAIGGMFFAFAGAAIETALSAAYGIAQFFGWPWGRFRPAHEASRFTIAWLAVFVLATAVILTGVDPVSVVEYSIVFSVVILPLSYLPLLLVAGDRRLMFTARAEYRLQLREDNADLRLTEHGRRLGVVDDARWVAFCRKRDAIAAETERLKSTYVSPNVVARETAERVLGQPLERERTLADLLRRPGVTYRTLHMLEGAGAEATDEAVAEQVEIATKYAGYIDRQQVEVARQLAQESLALPRDLDYATVRGLSIEVQQKLKAHRPETLGQAARLSGVTPAAVSLLLVHLKRGTRAREEARAQPVSHPA